MQSSIKPRVGGSTLTSSWQHIKVFLDKTLKPRTSNIINMQLSNNYLPTGICTKVKKELFTDLKYKLQRRTLVYFVCSWQSSAGKYNTNCVLLICFVILTVLSKYKIINSNGYQRLGILTKMQWRHVSPKSVEAGITLV